MKHTMIKLLAALLALLLLGAGLAEELPEMSLEAALGLPAQGEGEDEAAEVPPEETPPEVIAPAETVAPEVIEPSPESAALALNVSELLLFKGVSSKLSLTFNGEAVAAKQAKWTSDSAKVVSVSRGKVKGLKAGEATITATYQGETAACVVRVVLPVTKVKLNRTSATLAQGSTLALKATLTPKNAYDQTVTWTSSKPSVASVDENGVVTGLSKGSATITATSVNGRTAKCKVTVKVILPKSLDFRQLYVTMNPGDRFEAAVTFSPEEVSDPRVFYESSDPAVATVDDSGAVTAVGVGTATITGMAAANPKAGNTFRVCVIEPGSARMAGLIIGINPGHQIKTIKKQYPLAPGSSKTAYGVKTGACGRWTRVNEYETNLAIGLKLMRILTEQGATVVITRTTNDVMLTNIDRAQMLNEAGVDVALQLHCNSWKDKNKEGLSGYIRTTGDWVAESRALSKALCKEMSAATGAVNLGVKIKNEYMSLNWTTTPSVLLEMGYLSNKKEDRLLASDDYREKMAQGICEGLCRYFGR